MIWRRCRSGPALRAAVLLVLLATAPEVGRAQDVEGTVISGPDSLPVSGVVVLLHRITADAGAIVDSTQTDGAGVFSFALESDAEPGVLYAAAALNQGVSYFGPALHPGMDAPDPYVIVVHDTETVAHRPEDTSIRLRHVVVAPTAHGLVQVTEVIDVVGLPDRTIAMDPPTEPIWVLELPSGVQSWSPLQGGLPPEALALAGDRLEVRATLPPSGMRVAFNYYRDGLDVDLSSPYPTERLEVILVDAEADRLEGLTRGSATDLPPSGGAARYVATGVEPGAEVGLRLKGESAPRGLALRWAIGGIVMLAAAALSAAWARRAHA